MPSIIFSFKFNYMILADHIMKVPVDQNNNNSRLSVSMIELTCHAVLVAKAPFGRTSNLLLPLSYYVYFVNANSVTLSSS